MHANNTPLPPWEIYPYHNLQDYEQEEHDDHEPVKKTLPQPPPLYRSQTSPVKKKKKKGDLKSSPSPTRGRAIFRIPKIPNISLSPQRRNPSPQRRNESTESERSASPIRFDRPLEILKHHWESTRKFATSPTKPKFTGYDASSPFINPSPINEAAAAAAAAGLKRSKTTGTHSLVGTGHGLPTAVPLTGSSSLRKRFGLSSPGDPDGSNLATNGGPYSPSKDSERGGGSISKSSVKSLLRQRSNRKEKEGGLHTPSPARIAALYRSQSTEADIRRDYYERDNIPIRPMSRDSNTSRPVSTIFMGGGTNSPLAAGRTALEIPKTSTSAGANPLSPIVASPIFAPPDPTATTAGGDGSPLPSLRRRKRRSSLSDLVLVKDETTQEEEKVEDEGVATPVLENSLSRAGSVDRKENAGNTRTMGPPPVPTHAKNYSVSSIKEGRKGGGISGAGDIYSDKIAPLNVSGVRLSRAHSDASTISADTRVSSRESAKTGNTTAGKLSTRLATEKTNISKGSGSLEQELALIGQELTRGGGRKGANSNIDALRSGNNTSRSSLASNADVDDTLRRRVKLLESRLNNTVNDLNKRYETLRDDSHTALAKELQRNQEIERMWRDERNENDAVYKKFNDALEECVRGLKGRTDEDRAGLVRMLVQSQEEVARLRGEVSALKKENIDLRHGKMTEL
ncbi:hypothetical protein AA313_de0202072 [Arthrobotrys entomopaga]|nr:hypothetical protein AA313_de0202072 [Arthrobotrys entomopaga]